MAKRKSTDGHQSPDDKILQEAKDRFKRCEEWESEARKLFLEDLKFANADADNGWQWPDSVRKNREIDDRPCLTINKTKQHCLQIINDGRQHSPAIKVHPINSGATVESAKLLDGIVRHIEYRSNAQSAYNTGAEFSVFGGIGYWRVTTDYANDDSFDQEIFIRRIKDPMTVYLDPDISEIDGSDSKFGFVFSDMTKAEFEYKYGEDKTKQIGFPLGEAGGSAWLQKDHVRVAEYFRVVISKDQIAAVENTDSLPDELQNESVFHKSEIGAELWGQITDDGSGNVPDGIKLREVDKRTVEWFLIAGDQIIDRNIWSGKYIPIVRVPGEEIIIDGKLERKGHVRTLKDPQRMYNYWSSSATEQVALQSKTPYIAAQRAIDGYEQYWKTANTSNYSYLPYNDIDESGQPVEKPSREAPPVMAQAYIQGMQTAAGEMMMVSGQYQAIMGQQSNETSGVAIANRQRQGDNATYHFIDHLANAVRFTGRIIVDLIPKVYDTPRVMRILGEDGKEDFINIDPAQKQALIQQQGQMANEIKHTLNPAVGNYDVVVDTGPAYSTRRQEAFAALSGIMAQNGELMAKAGDLLFKAADFPMAQDLAERLERTIPPALKGQGPDPQVQQLQQQNQQLQSALKNLTDSFAELKKQRDSERVRASADVYRAETDRIEAIHKVAMDQVEAAQEFAQAGQEMAQTQGQYPFTQTPEGMSPLGDLNNG